MNLEQQTLNIIKSYSKHSVSEKVVFILGLTGSGKTTLIEWLWNSDVLKVIQDGRRTRIEGKSIGVDRCKSTSVTPSGYVSESIRYVDCPGFRGTRGPAHRLATSYFIKTFLDTSKQVKFVLVVDHYASHKDLIELLEYVSSYIKDVEKFSKSILFVSTGFVTLTVKCDNYNCYSSSLKGLPSAPEEFKQKLDELWKILEGYNPDSGLETPFGLSPEKIKIFTTLLAPRPDKSRLLGWMEQPKLGIKLLSEDGNLKESCKKIWNSIYSLEFCNAEPADFCYGLSGLTETELVRLIEDSSQSICVAITLMYESMSTYLNKMTEESQSFHLLSKKINRNCAALRRMKEKLVRVTTIEEFSSSISIELSDIDLIEVKKAQEKLMEHIKWLKVWLNYLPVGDHVRLCRKWKNVVIEAEKECYNHKLWYNTLKQIHDETSSYETQLEKYKYDVSEVADWGQGQLSDKHQSVVLRINANNVHHFLSLFLSRFMGDEQELPPVQFITGQRLDHLRRLIQVTIKSPNRTRFINGILIIQGNFICSSQVLKRVNDLLQAESSVVGIRLEALHTIYIDSDFYLDNCELTLIAPHIKTIGERKFSLNPGTGNTKPSSFLCVTRTLQGCLKVSGTNGSEAGKQIGVSVTGDEPSHKAFGELPVEPKNGCNSIFLCRRVKLKTPNVVQGAPDLITYSNESYSFIETSPVEGSQVQPTTNIRYQLAKVITEYKMNILKHLNDFWLGETLQRFVEEILCHDELDSLCSYDSLRYEFEYLNENNSSNQDQVRLLPFYKALSQRVDRLIHDDIEEHPIEYNLEALDSLQNDLKLVMEDMEQSIARKFTIDIPGYFESQLSKVMDFNQLKTTLKSLKVATGSGDEIQLKVANSTNSKKQQYESNLQAMYQTAEYLGILDTEDLEELP